MHRVALYIDMAIDTARIDEFINENSLRRMTAAVLREAGFAVVRVTEDPNTNGSIWSYNLKLNRHMQDVFGFSREVLFYAAQFSDFQARTVLGASTQIKESRPRLSEDFAIIVTHDEQTRERAIEAAESLDTIFVGFSFDELRRYKPYGDLDFAEGLQKRLYSRDLYDVPTAATRSSDFFGRREMIAEIATRLREGGKHIGLFGLRKIGKTSLLYRLKSSLQNTGGVCLAHVDVERMDAINPSAEYLVWSLGESIYDSHRQVRKIPELALLGKHRLYSSISDKSAIFESFDHDIRAILSRIRNPLVVMFDEVELLSPGAPGSQWGGSFVRVWRLLRGLDQQFPNRISFFVTGTNPRVFEENSVGGQENPVYNYFSVQYLKPLWLEEVKSLLITLGKRMGLTWKEEATTRVFEATGGHPALVRALASVARMLSRDDNERGAITASTVQKSIDVFFAEKSSLLSQIVTVLQEQYKDEYWLLELLATGRIGEFREYAQAFPSDVSHLLGYGLCVSPSSCSRLEIELLQTYIQRRSQRETRVVGSDALPPDTKVGDYEIVAEVGNPGGFSRVYQARSKNGAKVAIKVFKNALLSALQRELEPLQDVNHPHVVRVIDFGKTDGGIVYLATEYLDGGSLRAYCTATTRAGEPQAVRWTCQLLSALAAIHPNEEKIDQLRQEEELTVEQFEELAEARHGFVHRDIKPENVMLSERGVVLIDFNIASRASSPVMTQSMTPGYHPPDGIGVSWSPDIDLFQLGVTMLQVVAGVAYSGDNINDIRTLASSTVGVDFGKVLLKMTSSNKEDRFKSADEALAVMRRLDPDWASTANVS